MNIDISFLFFKHQLLAFGTSFSCHSSLSIVAVLIGKPTVLDPVRSQQSLSEQISACGLATKATRSCVFKPVSLLDSTLDSTRRRLWLAPWSTFCLEWFIGSSTKRPNCWIAGFSDTLKSFHHVHCRMLFGYNGCRAIVGLLLNPFFWGLPSLKYQHPSDITRLA